MSTIASDMTPVMSRAFSLATLTRMTSRTDLADGGPHTALLTQTAVYAFRALSRLAALPEGESASAPELAKLTNVPLPYLSKVLRRLVARGLLSAQRGHRGGFALARPPASVSFIEVLEALDQMPAADRCAFGWGRCNGARPCPLHASWDELNRSFRSWATTSTLADVVG